MKKLIKWVVLGGVLLAVLLVVVVWFWGDAAAKKGIEMGGTSALGTETTVDSVRIGWLTSSVAINQLQIANPEGYKTDRLMALGHGRVACDIGSFFTDEVVIRELILDMPELTIEYKGGLRRTSNLSDVLSSGEKEEKPEPEPETPEQEGEGKRFRLDLLRISGAKVRIHLLAGKTMDVTLPTIELKDVRNSDGSLLLMADVFRQILAAMGHSVVTNVKDLPADLLKVLEGGILASGVDMGRKVIDGTVKVGTEAAKKTLDATGKVVEEGAGAVGKAAGTVGKVAEEGAKAAGEGVKKVREGVGGAIKGILGGGDKEKE
jgi:hypothetical protein